ncbi:MAG: hypothetical protein AAGC46_00650 [Solirubrobacteraceae bacterium]|nr:hypothetical protein [Patulibacter sp.]
MRPLHPTSRGQLLALSEYARRREGGIPGFPDGTGLGPYELKVFSQNGEDGVIGEILRRAGIDGPGFFVEFGAEDGVETNTALLADVFGWRGVLLEGDPESHGRLHRKYGPSGRVTTRQTMVEPHTIEGVLAEMGVPADLDLLSIDIDSDDYWVWKAITGLSPKVVVIEVNTHQDPRSAVTQPIGAGPWQGTDFYGASVGALRGLAAAKGYRFVHVDLTGNNAFFVRDDVPGDYPAEPLLLGPNHYLLGGAHPPDATGRAFEVVGGA